MSVGMMLKKPSAFLPIAMSLAALALVVFHLVVFGPTPQADEGTEAHLFQLLLAGEVLIVAYFAIRWLPRHPWPAFEVLLLQAAAVLAALAPVFIMRW